MKATLTGLALIFMLTAAPAFAAGDATQPLKLDGLFTKDGEIPDYALKEMSRDNAPLNRNVATYNKKSCGFFDRIDTSSIVAYNLDNDSGAIALDSMGDVGVGNP